MPVCAHVWPNHSGRHLAVRHLTEQPVRQQSRDVAARVLPLVNDRGSVGDFLFGGTMQFWVGIRAVSVPTAPGTEQHIAAGDRTAVHFLEVYGTVMDLQRAFVAEGFVTSGADDTFLPAGGYHTTGCTDGHGRWGPVALHGIRRLSQMFDFALAEHGGCERGGRGAGWGERGSDLRWFTGDGQWCVWRDDGGWQRRRRRRRRSQTPLGLLLDAGGEILRLCLERRHDAMLVVRHVG